MIYLKAIISGIKKLSLENEKRLSSISSFEYRELSNDLELKEALQQSQSMLKAKDLELDNWQEKYNTLKMANTILGSDNDKRETKLKINALIREIDHCISQLSS